MKQKQKISLIVLTALLTFLMSFVSFAKTQEVGPGIVIVPAEQELFSMINERRGQKNLNPLIWDDELAKVAATRASEIAVSYGHTRPNGSAPQTAYKEAGIYFSRAGENLAEDLEEAEDVYYKWYRSSAGRENLLRKEFTHAAIAYFDRPNENGTVTRYWVMELMKPKAAPADAEEESAEAPAAQTGAPAVASGEDIPEIDAVPAP